MPHTYQNGYSEEAQMYEEQFAEESPFADPRYREMEERLADESSESSPLMESWEFTTPFLPGESMEAEGEEVATPEVAAFSEITAELKDSLFREALEQLADEALEAHAEQLAGEYGDRETREASAMEMLNEHMAPLAMHADAMLERFFERLEGYEAEALTDMEISRISGEVMPSEASITPAQEQFLGGLLKKAGKLVSGAVDLAKRGAKGALKLAGKGLSALGKLALGPLLAPLKLLGKFLLQHVVRFALGQLPPALRPLGQKLSERLFRAVGIKHESENENEELPQHESLLPASHDAASLEAEFDVHAAQLLFTSDEQETEHLVNSYGESEGYTSPLMMVDDARAQMTKGFANLQPGESAQPVMEQFLPAVIWPAAKTAITILGRPKLVAFIGKLLSSLVKPLIGAEASKLLAPAIADAGLRIFGLEAEHVEPRMALAEALTATVEETVNAAAALPQHVLENETLLAEAVQEAFENAAAAYFPNSAIKPELHESAHRHGMWSQMPRAGSRKRYAKYSDSIPIEVSPRAAGAIDGFGRTTLRDHLHHDAAFRRGHPYKGSVTLYQALPGTRGSSIARAEGFPASQLHPLTPQAAGVLLGANAALGRHATPPAYMATPQRLHVGQRLYRIAPASGRMHHSRHAHSELAINLQRGEIRLWLYLSEPMCQSIVAHLNKDGNPIAAYGGLKRLIQKTTEALRSAITHHHHHLPHDITIVGGTPHPSSTTPHWLRHAGHRLAGKIREWTEVQLAQYLRNNAQQFKQAASSSHDGVTLRFTMTRVPGLHALLRHSEGKPTPEIANGRWPSGHPVFHVMQRAGHSISKLRD